MTLAARVSEDDIRRAFAERSLRWWCRYVDPGYQHPAHLVRLCEKLETVERGEIRRLMVCMPPRHGKSLTTTQRFPGWYLGRNPSKRVIIAAHTSDLATTFSRVARNEVEQYAGDTFGISLADDSSAVQHWNIKGEKGGLVAAGVGGPLTGQGADLLIIDDPIKDYEGAFSETQRASVKQWYRTVARTRLHPGGAIIIVATRWHEDDLIGWLLSEETRGGEKWEVVSMPMVDDSTGAILWPDRYTDAEVEGIRSSVGSYAWEALFQQRPSPPSGDILKRDWWKFYDTAPTEFDEVIDSWDCTFKDTKGADYVVGQKWGRKGADKYLLAQTRDKMSFTATLNAIRALAAKQPVAPGKLVEDKANGPAVINTLKREIPGLIPVEPQGGKEVRARAVSPQIESGNVYLPKNAPWVYDFIEECASFPNGKHDDQVDAMSQALLRLSSRRTTGKLALNLGDSHPSEWGSV